MNQMHDLHLKNEVKGNYKTVQAFEILNADDIELAEATVVRPRAINSIHNGDDAAHLQSDTLAAKMEIGKNIIICY
jgi:hypothetical protein